MSERYIDTGEPRKTYPPKQFKRTPIQAVQVQLLCESCGSEMRFSGTAYPTHPQKYDHFCVKCGKHDIAWDIYPTIEYEPVAQELTP